MLYRLVRSNRKTIALTVTKDLEVLVRAPLRASRRQIDRFVGAHENWVRVHMDKQRQYNARHKEPDEETLKELSRLAKEQIPPRVARYAAIMGIYPTGVKITRAKTRFGSCSAKNSLCFSCRLMLYDTRAVDYVIVHELAHIAHKNHGKDFYALIESVLPDYKARRALLKEGYAPGGF
ncbi:MAG: M48 family metallopeptidase [Christensenellales bacterium]